jgi:hypothetical protein
MTRGVLIEMIVRDVYGEMPDNDRAITDNLVNTWIEPGIGLAVKQAYKDSIAFDGVSYVNNSFSTQFKGITFSKEADFIWKGELPALPMGLGKTDGINTLRIRNSNGNISDPLIPLSEQQVGYAQRMRPIPNKSLYWPEGKSFYVMTALQLNEMTANVSMVSAGDPTALDSELNVPADYIPIILDYCTRNLLKERMTQKDITNDKRDN